jgi:hypothetical protein
MGPGVVMASVAVSVLNWLALSYIVWCIRSGNGEHLFRRRGFCVKWCAGMGGRRVLSHSLEDAGTEHDDSADEDERNGRCEQAASPDADRSHRTRPQVDLQYLLRWLVKISLHLKALPKDGSPPPLFVSAGVESV